MPDSALQPRLLANLNQFAVRRHARWDPLAERAYSFPGPQRHTVTRASAGHRQYCFQYQAAPKRARVLLCLRSPCMADQPLNVLRSAELKRRGIAAVEQALQAGPVHLLKRNSPTAVVLSEADYNRLMRLAARPAPSESSCLNWLLALPPAATARSKQQIDTELRQDRDW